MKVMFDPIYTQDVSRCASAAKFRKLADHILKTYPDSYIYWPIPPADYLGDPEYLPKTDRILYLSRPFERDRYRDYRRFEEYQERYIAHYGDYWDWDILVTNRSSMVPIYRQVAGFHSSQNMAWAKQIMLLEDFPLMHFKGSAAVPKIDAQEMMVIAGHAASDAVAISAYWEKALIIEAAKSYFAPAIIQQLRKKIHEATPVIVEKTELKQQDFLLRQHEGKDTFTIAFAGRMVIGHHFDKIFDLMEKNWILKQGPRPVECHVCTQSRSTGKVDVPDFVKVNLFERQQFWDFMKNKASVGVFFSEEEDYSMSLIEPIILGVPYAVYRAPWSEASLGPDYPFFFKSAQEAYTIVKMFYDDYATQYLKFAKWSKQSFQPLLQERNKVSILSVFDSLVKAQQDGYEFWAKTSDEGEVVQMLVAGLDKEPGDLVTLLERAKKHGYEIRHLQDKLSGSLYKVNLVFQTDRTKYRHTLRKHGAIDAGAQPGVVKLNCN